jgi:hypothetical protein
VGKKQNEHPEHGKSLVPMPRIQHSENTHSGLGKREKIVIQIRRAAVLLILGPGL